MIVSIGILAHNEAEHIGALIDDLGRQTILKNSRLSIHIHVVANGCTDDTVDVSRRALQANVHGRSHITTNVHDLARAGKANAWNEFVHAITDKNTDYVFLLDGDIRLVGDHTLALTLEGLFAVPTAVVAVDEPVKDVSLKSKKSIVDRIILSFSRTTHNARTAIAGSFYCARYSVVRHIWLPSGIIGEDGFLRAMILTASFKEPENMERLIFVDGARHSFETRRNLRDIVHHQIRLAMGTGVNVLLFAHLRRQLERMDSIEHYIKARNEADSRWLSSLVAEEMKKGKYFVMNQSFLTRRPKHFLSLPLSSKIVKLPVYALGTVVDLLVYVTANHLMRKGAAEGFW